MKFSISTAALNEALSISTHALSARSTMPILEGILIRARDGELNVICSDGNMSIDVRTAATIAEEGSVILPGRLLMDVVRRLPNDECVVTVGINHVAVIRCGGSRTTLAGKDAEQFPALPHIEGHKSISLPQPLLKNMIQKTSFSISTDETRKILTGALLELQNNELSMVALDSFRLALMTAPLNCADTVSAVIPGHLLQELVKILSDDDSAFMTITFGASQMMVQMEDVTIYSTLLEGEYIQYKRIIPTTAETKVTVLDRSQMELCVDRAALLAREGKTNLIKLHITHDMMTITSNAEMGDVYEEVGIDAEGPDLDIAFNVRYIQDVIKVVDDDSFTMNFNSPVSPCVIKSTDESAGYLYMALPVRVNA